MGFEGCALADLDVIADLHIAADRRQRRDLAVVADVGVMANMNLLHQPRPLTNKGGDFAAGIDCDQRFDTRGIADVGFLANALEAAHFWRVPDDSFAVDHFQEPANGAGPSAATVVWTIAAAVSASMTRRF